MKEKIEFTEFLEIEKKLEIIMGQVVSAERIPKSTKLIKMRVNFTGEPSEDKSVVTNLGSTFEPSDFEGKKFPFITNLIPSTMMGVVSEAMIIVGTDDKTIELYDYSIGSKLM